MQNENPSEDPNLTVPGPQLEQPPDEQLSVAVAEEELPLHRRVIRWYADHKKISLPLTALLLLVILAIIPVSRYGLSGLVVKNNIKVSIQDATTNTPVSAATLTYDGHTVATDANGEALLPKLKAGHHKLVVSKKYYKDQTVDVLSPILGAKKSAAVSLVATGRQVSFSIFDAINGKAISGAKIEAAGTEAKTDDSGAATLVVPSDPADQQFVVTDSGYNRSELSVKVNSLAKVPNQVKLVPAGKIYFFSKRTGRLDLMKSNLDGSEPETVLAGTGTEQVSTSSIAASPDWHYIALTLKRSPADPTPQLYVLSAADDRLLTVETGNANFGIVGWAGDSLIYSVARLDLPDYQTGKNKIKSYDATTGKISQLDQTKGNVEASGNSWENYRSIFLIGDNVIFGKSWTINGTPSSQQNSLNVIGADGQGFKSVDSFPPGDVILYSRHSSNGIYVWQQPSGGEGDTFLDYQVGSSPKQISLNSDQFYGQTTSYFLSPSGKYVLWSEPRDGKNTLLVDEPNGNSPEKVGEYSDLTPYGWYTDRYLILSKNGSELYISGLRSGTPQKVTDYQSTAYYY